MDDLLLVGNELPEDPSGTELKAIGNGEDERTIIERIDGLKEEAK